MHEHETLQQINAGYICPPDAGPEWRASVAAGYDMSLLEGMLESTPAERMREHQQVLDFLLKVQDAGGHEDAS